MENYQSSNPHIKIEEVKHEIKWEQHEIDELETIKTEIDSKVNVKLETYKQENEANESKAFIQTEKIEIKPEETEEGYIQELDELNEDVLDAENNTSTPNASQGTWKCHICHFCHNNKDELKAHITSIHKDPLNLNLFKCDLCDYRTEYLDSLARHKNRRKKQCKTPDTPAEEKTDSDVKMQKCHLCAFTYQTKIQLGEHIVSSHKDPLDSNRFKCTICDYVTKYFHQLIRHKSYHDCPVGTKWYHCYKCSYRSRQKNRLKRHVEKHKGISKVDFYKSPSESVARSYFVRQTITGNNTKLKLYGCDLCVYKTDGKGNLKKHMLKHKGWDEVKVYQCDVCEFCTKHKCSLSSHMRRHCRVSS